MYYISAAFQASSRSSRRDVVVLWRNVLLQVLFIGLVLIVWDQRWSEQIISLSNVPFESGLSKNPKIQIIRRSKGSSRSCLFRGPEATPRYSGSSRVPVVTSTYKNFNDTRRWK